MAGKSVGRGWRVSDGGNDASLHLRGPQVGIRLGRAMCLPTGRQGW